jgi:hypothetical protein
MAKTEDLLTLINEYPTAFEDPESVVVEPVAPNPTESVKNQSPTEPDKVSTDDKMTDADWCQMYLLQLEYEPSLMTIASRFLEELATVADMRKCFADRPIVRKIVNDAFVAASLDLPETYARQGTADCPSGACPLDH